tara:strand:+ start:1566 stop:3188 length:1623 start_codon:yes stop_codon:yes gene_type:complete
MPVVFSPGEPETRPLEPDAIVYTTAQKVADLLGIGPSEAVLASANTEADRVYVTGSDYRSHGFAVGDTILIYSDAQALGVEKKITAVTEGGSNGVALYFTGDNISNISDYQTADNTYIQNQAAFTNGKTSGMKRSVVETRIKEVQDRIDNITHNAWRPYLVSAEYLNFDTYKPYRRRYYTDYVGTVPLLFRNVQQMLRIELWQGDDYREVCGAEIRLKFDDVSSLPGKKIALGLQNGHAAVLEAGTGTTKWRGEIDAISTAQNFADLINKEDRVSKAAVNFLSDQTDVATTFTLEGSTSPVAVHNEFLASANTDYGTGVVKLTSMRQGKGGEKCSIALNTDDVSITKASTVAATTTGVYASNVINVDSTEGFLKSGVGSVGGTTAGLRAIFSYTGKSATQFTGVKTIAVTASGGLPATNIGTSVKQHQFGLSLQGGSGDQARLKDWWIDYEMGIIYFNNSYPFFEHNAVKVSYIYGERYLEKAIEEAATKMVAADLLLSDDRSVLIPEGSQNVDLGAKIQLFRKEAEELLVRYKEVVVFS